uniref:Protein phosphatase 1 regulatory inhibitor subunit 14D n=1 Tax=Gasterosteus aculeatus aculeatus TaxID=481459 RepID=A0AAQ4QMH7_GASAC
MKATLHSGSLQQAATQSRWRVNGGDEMNVAPSFTDSSASRTKSSRPFLKRARHVCPASCARVDSSSRSSSSSSGGGASSGRSARAPRCPPRRERIARARGKDSHAGTNPEEEEIPELEIDIDELLELTDEGQRIRLQELLHECGKPKEDFINGLLYRIKGLRKMSGSLKK